MASLIESAAAKPAATSSALLDYKASTMDTAERLTSLIYGGYGDDSIANPQQSSLIALDDELWRELYLLPTPPLSPDNPSPSPSAVGSAMSTQSVVNDIAPGTNSGLFVEMMGYDQMMDVLDEAERVLSDSQQAALATASAHNPQDHLLLQDCMWGHGASHYDSSTLLLGSTSNPTGIPATAANTSAGTASTMDNDSHGLCNDTNATNDTQPLSSMDDRSHDPDQDEPDCVEPSAVFPVLRTSSDNSRTKSATKLLGSTSSNRSSMSSSESEEEIDVVTVERSSVDQLSSCSNKSTSNTNNGRTSSKKQSNSRISSVSNTTSRKKRHTKKISRRSSEEGAESDEEARRASHNVLERKRRNDLKNSFDELRSGIPDLEGNVKPSKVVILKTAIKYISGLQTTEQRTKVEFTKEQSRHKKLMERLSILRNGF